MVRLSVVVLKTRAWRGQVSVMCHSRCQDQVNHVEIYFNGAEAKEEIMGCYPCTIKKECSCGIMFEILLGLELIEDR